MSSSPMPPATPPKETEPNSSDVYGSEGLCAPPGKVFYNSLFCGVGDNANTPAGSQGQQAPACVSQSCTNAATKSRSWTALRAPVARCVW